MLYYQYTVLILFFVDHIKTIPLADSDNIQTILQLRLTFSSEAYSIAGISLEVGSDRSDTNNKLVLYMYSG